MHIIWTIVVGFAVGLIARAVLPGRDDLNIAWTSALGIAGALVGSGIGRAVGLYQRSEPAGLLVSVIGAVAVLTLYRYVVPGATSSKPR